MIIPENIFREYDIRGLADSELTDEFCQILGRAYAKYLADFGVTKCLIGRDNRLSSDRIYLGLAKGLLAGGLELVDLGVCLSPMLYFARIHLGIDGGVMITASHNAPQYNGFKLAHGEGTIYGEEIQKLKEMMKELAENEALPKIQSLPDNLAIQKEDIREDYLDMLIEKIGKLSRPLKVVADCGSGTTSLFLVEYLQRLGCEVIAQHCESDGSFPFHLPDPVKLANIEDLIERVKKEKADLGIGIDGDGDRLGVVTERGEVIWGDILLILFSREVLAKHPGAKVIVEVKASQATLESIKKFGGVPIVWKTGHSLIKAKMKEEQALLAGEMSGHFFFADEYFGYDDAFYAAGRLLRILADSNKTFEELLVDIPKYYSTPELRPYCPDERKFAIIDEIIREAKKKFEVIDIDGARLVFPDGWGLIRASNTQPALIVRAEGKTKQALEHIKTIVSGILARYPEVKFNWEVQGE